MKKPALVLLTVLALLSFLAPAPSPAATPLFLTNSCTSSYECPTGEICCWVCGNPPADPEISCLACVEPVKGRCPMVY